MYSRDKGKHIKYIMTNIIPNITLTTQRGRYFVLLICADISI